MKCAKKVRQCAKLYPLKGMIINKLQVMIVSPISSTKQLKISSNLRSPYVHDTKIARTAPFITDIPLNIAFKRFF
ncbi:MAG: hypothetical protein RLZZ628_1775 [Bacteroidota bacterium]|jgi:hypothetical protein